MARLRPRLFFWEREAGIDPGKLRIQTHLVDARDRTVEATMTSMPWFMGRISDNSSTALAYGLPLVCFAVVLFYALSQRNSR